MKVRATQMGFYGLKRRREGEVFDLVDKKIKGDDGKEKKVSAKDQFSKEWMEPADEDARSLLSRHIDEDQPEGRKTADQIELANGNEEEEAFLAAEGKKKAKK